MAVNYRKLKDEWKKQGRIPEWYSSNALQFFMETYSYEGEDVKTRDETTNAWLAKFAPEVYPDWWYEDEYFKGLTWEQAFNKLDWDGFTIKSTPLKANGGLPQRGLTVSCCGQDFKNSIAAKAFARGELEVLIKNSHGCSMTVSDWLAEGVVYDSDGNRSHGILPIIDELQEATGAINQGIRRGVTLFGVDALHGDFWKVAKKLFDEADTLNIAWLMTDEFTKLLEQGDEETIKRWNKILYIRMAKGKGYFTKIDTMNRNKAQIFKDKGLVVKGSNLCVAPETLILTDKGYEVISDLENQKVNVWNGKEWSETTVVKTGENKKLLKVSTNFNQVLECTPDHKFYVQVGSINRGGKIYERRAKDLKVGDRLIKFDLPVIEGSKALDNAYTNGFYSGDGCYFEGSQMTYLYHEKQDLLPFIQDVKRVRVSEKQNRTTVYHNGNLKDKYFVPTSEYLIKSRLEWLSGLCDSDGTVSRNGETEGLQIGSIHLTFLQEVQLMLQTLGVTSTINFAAEEGFREMPLNDGSGENGKFYCQNAYRLLINANGLFKLSELGFETHRLVWKKRRPNRECDRFMTIKSVEDLGRYDDTFCFTEPKRHMGMFNGILTGQCNEVNLPVTEDYSFTCVIINANLTLYRQFPKHLFHVLHVMQDCNVSGYIAEIESKSGYNALFLNKVLKFTKDFRAVGTGVAGFHSLLMQEGIVYGSLDSFYLNNKIFREMRRDLEESSRWLAEVMGEPEGMKGTGMRNATLMMMPPTKSSAELARNTPSESINPTTGLVKVKETVGGDIWRIEPVFLRLLKEKGKYTEDIISSIARAKGSVQHLDFLTQEEKDVFRIAFEIPMEAHLDLCSQRQKYIDQQQSINLYLASHDSVEYIAEIHKKALLDEGINGLYYCYSSRGGSYERADCVVCT